MVYKEYSTIAGTKINVRKTNLVELVNGRKALMFL
jgi:hypothetical protein